MLTNKVFSENLGIPISKVRRNTKEFLGEDPKATRRSGYKREFSINDGFFVYLGGHLVTNLGLSFEGARKALEKLKPWLLLNGFVPDIPDNAIRVGADRKMETDVIISLIPTAAYIAESISKKPIEGISPRVVSDREPNIQFWIKGFRGYKITDCPDSLGRPCQNVKSEEIGYAFGRFFEDNKIKIPNMDLQGHIYIEKKEIRITAMLINYIRCILGKEKEKEWVLNWKALAKKDPTEAEKRIRKGLLEGERISYAEAVSQVLNMKSEMQKNKCLKKNN